MNITWPTDLPLPQVAATGEPRLPVAVSPEASLIRRRRSRFTTSYASLSVEWLFTDEGFESFRSFVKSDLYNGAAQFLLELRFPTRDTLTWWTVRLSNSFDATYDDGWWRTTAQLDLVRRLT